MYFHVYLIYRFTRTFTDHSSVITKCWGFELQKRKIEPQKPANPCDTRLCSCIFFVNTLHKKALKSYDFKAFQFVKEPLSSFVENRGSLINWGAACVSADGSCFDPRPIRHTTRPRLRPHPRTSPGSPPKGPLGCHSRPECCRCGRCCQMGRRAEPTAERSLGGQRAGRDR